MATTSRNAPFSLGGALGWGAGAALGPLGAIGGALLGRQAGKNFGTAIGRDITRYNVSSKPKTVKKTSGGKQTYLPAGSGGGDWESSAYGYGGGGGGGGYADQLASQQKTLLDQLGSRLNTIYGSSQDAARQSGLGIDSTLKQFGLQQREAQRGIDQKGIQNEASKRAGSQDILGMINRGVRSGATMLANNNASNSSASEAIGRAYGDIGQREQSKVNNQYELGRNALNQEQQALKEQQDLYRNTTYANSKEQIVGGIVESAQAQLAELDNALRGASLPDRISIEAEKQKVRDLARGELAKYDALLQQELDSARGKTPDELRAEATRLAQLGQAPAGQFQYTTEAPVQFQGQPGPAGSNLPLYTFKRGQDDQALVPQVA